MGEYNPQMVHATAAAYDAEAQATGYLAPEVAFGLVYEQLHPGQSVLDLGIGTGLASVLFRKAGLVVHGMDISQDMLEACRWKGFDHLTRHDLAEAPYPYASKSFNHVVCVGVLPFLRDLSPVFAEVSRILERGRNFIFLTADRGEAEDFELEVGPEHTGSSEPVILHRHDGGQIGNWLDRCGLTLLRSLPFPVYMDQAREYCLQARCYVAQKA